MGRISQRFKELQQRGEKGLVTFITAGDPDLATTGELILALEKSGADFVELGVPFSDPMADGPTIQKSSERALAAGTTLPKILALVTSVRQHSAIPIILMGYYNPVFCYGPEKFAADAAAAGVDGVLLVDLPPEEAGEFKAAADRCGVDVIFLLTPTSDAGRISKVLKLASGFIYYVSVTGVTGARLQVAESADSAVARIKKNSKVPVVVGFGISDPAQAGAMAAIADGVVVGSALVKFFEEYADSELKTRLAGFVTSLKAGIRSVS